MFMSTTMYLSVSSLLLRSSGHLLRELRGPRLGFDATSFTLARLVTCLLDLYPRFYCSSLPCIARQALSNSRNHALWEFCTEKSRCSWSL